MTYLHQTCLKGLRLILSLRRLCWTSCTRAVSLTNRLRRFIKDTSSTLATRLRKSKRAKETSVAEWDKEIRTEFGAALDEQMGFAKKAAVEYGGEKLQDLLEEHGLEGHPVLIKMFAKIGASLGEDTADGSGKGAPLGTMTPDQAKTEIKRL